MQERAACSREAPVTSSSPLAPPTSGASSKQAVPRPDAGMYMAMFHNKCHTRGQVEIEYWHGVLDVPCEV